MQRSGDRIVHWFLGLDSYDSTTGKWTYKGLIGPNGHARQSELTDVTFDCGPSRFKALQANSPGGFRLIVVHGRFHGRSHCVLEWMPEPSRPSRRPGRRRRVRQ